MKAAWRKASGAVAAAGLAMVGVLHTIWVFSPWPFSSESEHGRYLIGDPEASAPPLSTAAVAAALFAGAYLALAAARLAPRPGPGWIYRLGNSGLIAVMVARGAGGWLFNAGAAEEFVTWNMRLYSPLCLAIALLVTLAWLGDHHRERDRMDVACGMTGEHSGRRPRGRRRPAPPGPLSPVAVTGRPAMSNRLPDTEHTSRPWRIHEITPDFRVEDVWAFRIPGAGPDDFHAMLAALQAAGGPEGAPPLARFLFAVRSKLAALFGSGAPRQGAGGRVRSLRERLPPDLRQAPPDPDLDGTPFTNLYQLGDEFAQELVIKTLHTVRHLGWVPAAGGDYELRMAALVKPNGLFGRLYMATIKPFRYLVIYPAMTRQWERAWRDHGRAANPDAATRQV